MPLLARIPTGIAPDVREAADERRAVERLELVEAAEPSTIRAITSRTSYGRARVGRHEVVELAGSSAGVLGLDDLRTPARAGGG